MLLAAVRISFWRLPRTVCRSWSLQYVGTRVPVQGGEVVMKTTRLWGFLSKDLCGLKVDLLALVAESA